MKPWMIGVLAGGALLLAAGGAQAAVRPGRIFRSEHERDLDALADMLITETSFSTSPAEMAQIVWVAHNRSRKQQKPIWFVVQPGRGPKPVWNTGPVYRRRFENARQHPRWADARKFAARVLSGAYKNLGKTSFVHPGAMPTPPCASNRVLTSTPYGQRCLPAWIQDGKQVGSALFA